MTQMNEKLSMRVTALDMARLTVVSSNSETILKVAEDYYQFLIKDSLKSSAKKKK